MPSTQAEIVTTAQLREDPDARPTKAELLAWRDQLEGEWGGLVSEQEGEADTYYQSFEVEAFGEALTVKTGSAPADCDAAIDSLVPKDLLLRRKPRRAREKYRKQALKLENMARAWLHEQRKPKDQLKEIASDMVIRRVGVGRVITDLSGWPELPKKFEKSPDLGAKPEQKEGESEEDYKGRVRAWDAPREAWQDDLDDWEFENRKGCPIEFERRDCRFVRWREHKGRLIVVAEKYQTTVLEAYQSFSSPAFRDKVRAALAGRALTDRIWVSDVWFKTWRSVFIDDHPIFPGDGDYEGVMEHGYPGIPYLIAAFREIPADDPADRYRGMLTNALQLYQMESSVLVMTVQMLRWNAWRTWTYWTKDGRPLAFVPGQGIPLEKRIGEYIEMPGGEAFPPETLQMVSVVDAYIQRNGVAQGPRTAEGTRSAQQLWAIQAQRSQKVEPAQISLTMMIEGALEMFTIQLEALLKSYGGGLTMPIPGRDKEGNDMGEVTVHASDIQGYYGGWIVNFGKRLDPALLQQAQALMTMAGNKWMPRRTSVELSSLTDSPQEWIDQLLEEAVEDLPFLKELAGLEQIAQWWGEDSPQYQMTMAKVMASKQAPQQPPQMQPTSPKGPVDSGGGVGDALAKAGAQRGGKPSGRTANMPRSSGRPAH